ncbi:MAG: hypothetical protein DWQ01_19170 [Planctomycetota bacterium]|nr:MAG: hypothetical protein DWQ01_19170 [Planctomycetota bacterium]
MGAGSTSSRPQAISARLSSGLSGPAIMLVPSACFALLAAFPAAIPQQLPEVLVQADNTVIDRSCRVRIPAGMVLEDADGNGVLHIQASGITVEFAPESPLLGTPVGIPGDQRKGIGVRLEGLEKVTLRGFQVHGFQTGIWASHCPELVVEDSDFSRNWCQRLQSTPEAEDSGDWLWPHRNDANEWRQRYGAGLYVEDSSGIVLRRNRAHHGQNGICLDRVMDSRIYDNDCSFLSGWGLALWRCSRNVISRNAFDFCIRGYSHGVYSRGQDSAGILCFEQCSENVIAENSATHGGDGFFGFAGREALGEEPAPRKEFDYQGLGCNRNLLIANDFSYAAAIGIEMTFSFENEFVGNRLVGGNYGVWGGYSRDTLIYGNEIGENHLAGVAIEHGSGNRVLANHFYKNRRGVELWWDVDDGLFDRPWVQSNHQGAIGNQVFHNRFEGDQVGLELRLDGESSKVPRRLTVEAGGNSMEGVARPLVLGGEAESPKTTAAAFHPRPQPDYPVFGDSRPIGGRAHLAGRENIVMTPWGPWDHQAPLCRTLSQSAAHHRFELHHMAPPIQIDLGSSGPAVRSELLKEGERWFLGLHSSIPGIHPYRARIRAANHQSEVAGTLWAARWGIRVFPWTVDPRQDEAGWRRQAYGEGARFCVLPELRLNYGHGGPSHLDLSEEVNRAQLPGNQFGTLATTRLPLTRGGWQLTTLSDDGVRVWLDGRKILENWTWHGPTRDTAYFKLTEDRDVFLLVEHFELDGYAVLELEIEPADS